MSTALPSYMDSSALEKILEHRFVSELTSRLWLDGCRDVEVLRSEVDAHGHDLVIEARGTMRHIQLKSMIRGGKKQHVTINSRLAAKEAGCVVWYDYDPLTLQLGPFRWFGTLPGLGLPGLGDTIAKHSKGDSSGHKHVRAAHREIRKSKFQQVESMQELVPLLFGYERRVEIELLQAHLSSSSGTPEQSGLGDLRGHRVSTVLQDLRWASSVEIAHMVDGYDLVTRLGLGDPFEFEERQLNHALETGRWLGGPAVLWATLFLEHRRWRTASIAPDVEMERLLDRLCRQLVESVES